MDKQSHLLVCISAHGFGHVAQTAPIINELHARLPNVRITVRSMVRLEYLRSRIHAPFDRVGDSGDASDIGMLMSSALDVDAEASADAYRAFHRDWEASVMHEAAALRELKPDFVLANVGYLPLAGAHHAGIPCAAMSSLNWADIFAHYCGRLAGGRQVIAQMGDSYGGAGAFLRLTPGMPMDERYHPHEIGPVADVGRFRRDEINARLNLTPDRKVVLVSLGGVAGRLPTDRWPRLPGVSWLVPASWRSTHPDACTLESLGMPFGDILASIDTLICKPGYGSFVEAACSGVPVLYSRRDDWPETAVLAAWLDRHAACREVSRTALEEGGFAEVLQLLLVRPRPQPVAPAGIVEAADWLQARLGF
ncbi:hypothetical protein GALL_343610 [mine drainage metagenome]|uniref:Uncharacterized protein n=1 Tax=mine drainage metagenome TaxID=410659 RepID=A0A1J5QKK1_9ZZZZ